MDWIKRNLVFVIVSALAVIALVGAGFYTWSGYQHNNEKLDKLNQSYEDLKRLTENPMVGSGGGKVDNTVVAQDQQKQIRSFIAKAGARFQAIAPIPAADKVSRDEYASALRLTIDQLQREATNNSVTLPPKYNFSFEAQRNLLQFIGIPQLVVQLGEVKTICDILNRSKVNMIESVRRERVSTDDDSGPPANYLAVHSQTNDLAIITPYEITFRCFSPELAAVLTGFANSPNGILVQSINIEPGAMAVDPNAAGGTPNPIPVPPPPVPSPVIPSRGDAFEARYGGKGGFERPPPPPVAPVQPVAVAATAKGPPILVNEKQLKVTMLLQIVKLLPASAQPKR